MRSRNVALGILLALLAITCTPPALAAPAPAPAWVEAGGWLTSLWHWFADRDPIRHPIGTKEGWIADPNGGCDEGPCSGRGWTIDLNGNKAGWQADPNGSCGEGPCPGRGWEIDPNGNKAGWIADPNGSCGDGPCPNRGWEIDPDGTP